MKHVTMFILLLLMACEEVLKEVPEEVYDNPLDIEATTEEGIETPALMFFPDEININTNEIFTVSVYALDVQNVAGAYININYDQDKLLLIAINPGTFFSDLQDPLYFSETQNSEKLNFTQYFLAPILHPYLVRAVFLVLCLLLQRAGHPHLLTEPTVSWLIRMTTR